MIAINRRVAGFAVLLALATGLSACGDSEADQRAAFIKFLQDINQRAGVHILKPTDADQKSFGDYAKQYAIIPEYNTSMGATSKAFGDYFQKVSGGRTSQTIEQMAANRDAIAGLQVEIAKVQAEVDKRIASLNAERAAFKQPDDLKAVYDVTFNKLVIKPTQATMKHMSVLNDSLTASLTLADYINSHTGKLTVKGSQIQANDQKTLDEIKVLMDAQNAAVKRVQDAGRDLQRVLEGS